MSHIYDSIKHATTATFEIEEDVTGKGGSKPITIRPSLSTIMAIDLLAKKLNMSRQSLIDEILDQGIKDAVDGYCEAHGTQSEEAKEAFFSDFRELWDDITGGITK